MNEFVVELLYFVASYLGITIAIFIGLQWLTKGYIGTYLKVKMSKGKKILGTMRSMTGVYYVTGKFEGSDFYYVGRDKKSRTVVGVSSNDVYPIMGVFGIEIDEVANKVIDRKENSASEMSYIAVDNLVREVAEAPRLDNRREKIILILLIGIAFVVLYVAYQEYLIMDSISSLQQISGLIQ